MNIRQIRFPAKNINRDKEGHLIMITESTYLSVGHKTILNICATNNRASKHEAKIV